VRYVCDYVRGALPGIDVNSRPGNYHRLTYVKRAFLARSAIRSSSMRFARQRLVRFVHSTDSMSASANNLIPRGSSRHCCPRARKRGPRRAYREAVVQSGKVVVIGAHGQTIVMRFIGLLCRRRTLLFLLDLLDRLPLVVACRVSECPE